jgi:hypothetical protein
MECHISNINLTKKFKKMMFEGKSYELNLDHGYFKYNYLNYGTHMLIEGLDKFYLNGPELDLNFSIERRVIIYYEEVKGIFKIKL